MWSGHFITQMSSQGTWVRGEIYADGEHIATYENDLSTPTTFFTHSDHLGTERVQTAVNGSSCETITNTAFGDGMNETGSCDPTALRFTDKLRDYETNLDDFGARFYSSQLGRFMSADWSAVPAPVPYANLNNPQTLNLYAIVADNPETFADLDGHCQDGDTAQSACATPFGANAGAFGEPAPNVAPDQKTGTGNTQATTQKAIIVTEFNNHPAVVVYTATKTATANSDGSTTLTSHVTTAAFSIERGHEGQFLGAEQSTSQATYNSKGDITSGSHTTTASDLGTATSAIGGQLVSRAQAGAATSINRAGYFLGAVGSDIQKHPLKYAGIAAEVGLMATPIPEAYEGARAVVDVGLAAAHLAWDLIH